MVSSTFREGRRRTAGQIQHLAALGIFRKNVSDVHDAQAASDAVEARGERRRVTHRRSSGLSAAGRTPRRCRSATSVPPACLQRMGGESMRGGGGRRAKGPLGAFGSNTFTSKRCPKEKPCETPGSSTMHKKPKKPSKGPAAFRNPCFGWQGPQSRARGPAKESRVQISRLGRCNASTPCSRAQRRIGGRVDRRACSVQLRSPVPLLEREGGRFSHCWLRVLEQRRRGRHARLEHRRGAA
eukprot:847284-Pleurochrysis_carterae.AAC.1